MTEFGAVRGNKNEVKHISSNLAWNSSGICYPDPTDAPQMPKKRSSCHLQICCMPPTSTCRAGLIGSSRDSTTSLPCLAAMVDILIDTSDAAEPETPTSSTADKFDLLCPVPSPTMEKPSLPKMERLKSTSSVPSHAAWSCSSCSVLCPFYENSSSGLPLNDYRPII